MTVTKVVIIIMLIAILYNLGHALYFLIKKDGGQTATAKALTWRIGLSLLLFILLMVGFALGVVHPHGIYS